MKVWQNENIVYVIHPVDSKGSEHGHLVSEARRLLEGAVKIYPQIAAYHDLSNSKSADNEYLQLWADVGKQFKEQGTYITVVSAAWMRTLVKTVAFLGRLDIMVVKTHEEAVQKLAEKGFRLRLESAPT